MKVLLATDGSSCSDAALTEVARRPWPEGSEVRLVTVDPPVAASLLKGSPTVFDELVERQRAESADRLRAEARRLSDLAPRLRVTTARLEGHPKDLIVAEAERWGADLVVLGSHGHGPIRRFFLGSVSLFVAHNAPCSVEIVRCPAPS